MKDALRARREGVLAVGFILGEEVAQGASSSQGPRAAPLGPAEIRLGIAFSRYVLDFSDKSALLEYIQAASLRDHIIAEKDLFEAAAPLSSAAGSKDDQAGVLRDSYA